MTDSLVTRARSWLKHDWAFAGLLAIFIFETVWLAVTSNFQMAFDEGWHFGLIRFYSTHLNPLVSSQPHSSYTLGAIIHNPSFLYHYLLSFPYRWSTYFTSSIKDQIIFLRFINIGLAVTGLILVRQILLKMRFSRAISNIAVFLLAFTPIFSVLAAQINYDNMVITATAGSILLMILFAARLAQGRFDWWIFGCQVCLLLLASVVKFGFLPILFAIGLLNTWFIVRFWQDHRHSFWGLVRQGLSRLRAWQIALLVTFGLVAGGLFASSYGYDLVKYHNVNPACEQVLSISACQQYYSWDRNYVLFTNKDNSQPLMNPVSYSLLWAKEGYYQLFAEIVPTGGLVSVDKTFYVLIIALTICAVLCSLYQTRTIFRQHRYLPSVLFIAVVYCASLWARNYHDYLHLGQAVAIQGRYLLPVLVYLYGFLALGVLYSLKKGGRLAMASRIGVGTAVVIVFLVFGGFNRYRTMISPNTHWSSTSLKSLTDFR